MKHADNGMPACRAGVFRPPVTDCTNTPTREHFDLGPPSTRRRTVAPTSAASTSQLLGRCARRPRPGAQSGLSRRRRTGSKPGGKFSGSRSTREATMTAIKQTSVCSEKHLARLRDYTSPGTATRRSPTARRTSSTMTAGFRRWQNTRAAMGHDRPGKAGAKCTCSTRYSGSSQTSATSTAGR